MPTMQFVLEAFKIAFSFALATVGGGILVAYFNRATWRQTTTVELFRKRYDEGVRFLDELSEEVGERFFAVQRLSWAMDNTSGRYNLDDERTAYFAVVANGTRSCARTATRHAS